MHADRNHTLDELGIARNAREEKLRARDAKMKDPKQAAEDARMAALYRQHVLGEKPPAEGFVPLGKVAPLKKEEEPVAGD